MSVTTINEVAKAFDDFKSYHAKELTGLVSKTEATLREELTKTSADVLGKYDALSAQQAATQKALEDNQKSIETALTQLNRTAGNAFIDTPEKTAEKQKGLEYFNRSRFASWAGKAYDKAKVDPVSVEDANAYTKAFEQYVRFGENSFQGNIEAQKAMAVGSEPDGGAWIQPPQRSQQIISRVFETSPMRQLATVVNITAHSFLIPMDPNRMPTGGWVSEMQPRSVTATPSLAVKEIVPQEIFAQPAVTQIMLEDAGFDVEAYINDKASEAFALDSNLAFVSGNGVGKPRGFLTYPAGSNSDGTNKWGEIEQVGSGTSGAFTYAGLVKAITAFRSEKYTGGLSWMFKRGSVQALMLLQNNANQYIFQPVANGSLNGTPLLGYPINYANDMPAIGAGALAGALGNFKLAYYIVDRVGISTIRDNLTAKPFILYYMRTRVGGDVVDYDGLKLIKLT